MPDVLSNMVQRMIFSTIRIHEYTKGLLKSIPRLDAKEHERLVPIEGTPNRFAESACRMSVCTALFKLYEDLAERDGPVTTFDDVHYTQCWMNQKEQMEREAAK